MFDKLATRYFMNPETGSVATLEEWQADFRSMTPEEWGSDTFEGANLVEVVKNDPDTADYDPSQGEWREVE